MNRRSFLKLLGLASVAPKVVGEVMAEPMKRVVTIDQRRHRGKIIRYELRPLSGAGVDGGSPLTGGEERLYFHD